MFNEQQFYLFGQIKTSQTVIIPLSLCSLDLLDLE